MFAYQLPTGANVPVDPTYMSEPSFPAYKQFHSANAPLEFEENEQMGVYPNNTRAPPALQRAGFPVTPPAQVVADRRLSVQQPFDAYAHCFSAATVDRGRDGALVDRGVAVPGTVGSPLQSAPAVQRT